MEHKMEYKKRKIWYKEFFEEEAANFIKVTQPNWLKLQHWDVKEHFPSIQEKPMTCLVNLVRLIVSYKITFVSIYVKK